jgi:HEAT repeat protein
MTSAPLPDIEGAIHLLKSEDVQIRQMMAYLLGQVGDSRAIEPLIDALEDADVGVRGAAANALGALGDQAAVPYLKPMLRADNAQMVVWAAFALTKLGHDRFDVLSGALETGDVMVRRSAILAMQQLADDRAIPLLLSVYHDPERRFSADNTVGEAAAKALVKLGYNVGGLPPR